MRRFLSAVAVLAILAGCGGGGGGGDGFDITQDMDGVSYIYEGGPKWTSAAVFYSSDLSLVFGALAAPSIYRTQGFTGPVSGAAAFSVSIANDDLDSDNDATNNILWPASGGGQILKGGDRLKVNYTAHEISPFNGDNLDVPVEFDGTLARTEGVTSLAAFVARYTQQ